MAVKSRPLPGHVARLTDEAGASAYQWYVQTALEGLDPSGLLTKTSNAIVRIGFWIACLGCVAFLIALSDWPSWAIGVLLVGLIMRKGRSVHWAAGMLTLSMILLYHNATATLLVLAATILVGILFLRPANRDTLFLWSVLGAAIATWAGDGAAPFLTAGVVVIVCVLNVWVHPTLGLPRPGAKITEDHLKARMPEPAIRLPWLVGLKGGRITMKSLSPSARIKKVGADGERRTAVALLALPRGRGTMIAHDVSIPGAKSANADHILLDPAGLFIIDSKQFGTQEDPGTVMYDMAKRSIVHRTRRGSRPIESSVGTAIWAAEGIGKLLGAPTRVLFLIHNADVTPGLSFERNGVRVDVVSVWALPSFLENSKRVFSPSKVRALTLGMMRLSAASTGNPPSLARPLGMSRSGREYMDRMARQKSGPTAVRGAPDQSRQAQPSASPAPASLASRPTPTAAPRPTPPPAAPAPAPPGAPMGPSVTAPARPGASGTPAPPAPRMTDQGAPLVKDTEVVMSAEERIADRWEMMDLSEAAAPDEVTEDLRGLSRGTRVLILEITDGDMRQREVVAMTGVCGVSPRLYIWFTEPRQYNIHCQTGQKVHVATIAASKIMVKPEV